MTESGTTVAGPERVPLGVWVWIALAVGLGLRVWEATESSLWLDELHTLFHASRPDHAAVIDSVRPDNHTPLFFLVVHQFGDWSTGAWLRWIPIATSLAAFPLLVAILREAGAGTSRILLSLWLYACLPYQVHYGAELRPYCFLSFFSILAFCVAFSTRGAPVLRFALFSLTCLLGLFSHMGMAITIFAIGCARLAVRRPGGLRLPALVLSGTLAVAGFLPWLLGFAQKAAADRGAFHEETGGYALREALRNELLALPVRLVEPFVGFLGEQWARVALAGTLLAAAALLVAFLAALVARVRAAADTRPRGVDAGLVAFALAAFAVITALSWYRWDRVPLHYFSGMAWTLPLFFARIVDAAPARGVRPLRVAVGAGALLMGVAMAGGTSRADVRGGVARLEQWGRELETANPARPPIYTAVLAQPGEVFDHALPFRAYAPELGAVEPEGVPGPGEPGFERPVLVYRRVLNLWHEKWKPITTGRRIAREEKLDWYTWVYVFVPEDDTSLANGR